MYLMIQEATLVENKRQRRDDDMVIYAAQWYLRGQGLTKVFHPWDESPPASRRDAMSDPVRYGTLYEDARGVLCIVPDRWDEEDAALAKEAIRS